MEEAHRRAEIARYLKMKEEEERRKRYQAELRRRQEEEEIRKRYLARELARQRQEEAYRQRLALERARQQQREEEEEQEPMWTIVRGPDGRLYRVLLGERDSEKADATVKRAHSRVESEASDTEMPDLTPTVSVEEEPAKKEVITKTTIPVTIKSKDHGKKSRRKKVTVIVEDASDSEDDDPSKSVWRNRRPSPGQSWMEPIESS
jgi:hypothetical protein